MIVRHNLIAENASRYNVMNNSRLRKSLEKLSSGYKINRAADNAAGLAVSEKMRTQIAGIEQAVNNAQDGISMVQTFEGALEETHNILMRMKNLSVQSANGTYTDETDRAAIELEYEQLLEELDDIAKTDFNGKHVLDNESYNPADYYQNVTKTPHPDDPAGFPSFPIHRIEIKKIPDYAVFPPEETDEWEVRVYDSQKDGNLLAVGVLGRLDDPAAAERGFTLTDLIGRNEMGTISGVGLIDVAKNGGASMDYGLESFRPLLKFLDSGTIRYEHNLDYNDPEAWNEQQKLMNETYGTDYPLPFKGFTGSMTDNSVSLQVGARTKDLKEYDFNYSGVWAEKAVKENAIGELSADINATASGLGLVKDTVNLSTQTTANAAIDKIDNAINKVSMIRATFGSIGNRLEHKIDSLNSTDENLTAAESRIRDTDMATEMMKLTKQQILSQSSQSMLAQANQLPQSVMQLLQG
jgi:flagellin